MKQNKSFNPEYQRSPIYKPKFQCQLAHGTPTVTINGFHTAKELYSIIADAFDIDPDDILFCTLNTFKLNMTKLLGSQVAYDDMIFAHVKGQKKEITLKKTTDLLGLTVTDNAAGYVFIKRIKESSPVLDLYKNNRPIIEVGDHIEKIDGISFIGKRHLDVANYLKNLPLGSEFTIRLISPLRSEFAMIEPQNYYGHTRTSEKNNNTIKLRSEDLLELNQNRDDENNELIQRINMIIENHLGIEDDEMARTLIEMCEICRNPEEVSQQIDTNFADFRFPNSARLDIWGAINDYRKGLLFNQQVNKNNSPPDIPRRVRNQRRVPSIADLAMNANSLTQELRGSQTDLRRSQIL